MTDKLRNEQMDMLIQAILSLKTPDDCYAFLEDLCTVSELKSMEQRFTLYLMNHIESSLMMELKFHTLQSIMIIQL